jgi:hypothetical protein
MAENQMPRTMSIIDASDYDIEDAYARLRNRFHYDNDGCWISEYAVNKSGFSSKKIFSDNNEIITIDIERGYPKLRLPQHGTVKGAYVFGHHVSFIRKNKAIRHGADFIAKWLNPAYDISHRCGKPRCFNPACLNIEHHDQNTTRDYCHGLNKNDVCPHDPPCKTRLL